MLKEHSKRVRLHVDKFSLGLLQFQDVGMQTFAEYLEQFTGSDREQVQEFIKREQDEDPEEKLFWDHSNVLKWSKVMKEN